jgi:hypothetical protein
MSNELVFYLVAGTVGVALIIFPVAVRFLFPKLVSKLTKDTRWEGKIPEYWLPLGCILSFVLFLLILILLEAMY